MSLSDVKLNTNCVIKNVDIPDENLRLRLMELGMCEGAIVKVIKKSVLKKTLLVVFNFSCFTLKDNLAKNIVVTYV